MSTNIQFKKHNNRKDDSKSQENEVVEENSEEVQAGGISLMEITLMVVVTIAAVVWAISSVTVSQERINNKRRTYQTIAHIELMTQISLAIDIYNIEGSERVVDIDSLVSQEYLQPDDVWKDIHMKLAQEKYKIEFTLKEPVDCEYLNKEMEKSNTSIYVDSCDNASIVAFYKI